ncbi:hypothetical protein KAT36_01235 [Candidatus Pacearchaeota archaeon]|nr:hypothetical protein [Candidatus Pacearchaeota archaeon]
MAIGWSGSSGGVGEAYRKFLLIDVEAGINKYKSLYENISEQQVEARKFYQKAITGLGKLKQEMIKDLEGRV